MKNDKTAGQDRKLLPWAFLIAAVCLFSIILILNSNEKLVKPDLTNMSCDDMVGLYESCVRQDLDVCREWYVKDIVDCYGEETLRDQLELINQTG